MTRTGQGSWPQVIRRSTVLLVVLVGMLGLATAGFVFWNKDRSVHAHIVINDYDLATAFKSASAREELGHLLNVMRDRLEGVDLIPGGRPTLPGHSEAPSASLFLFRQRVGEVLEIERRFADPMFSGLVERLERRMRQISDQTFDLRDGQAVSRQTYEDFRSLYTILTQLERLHVIADNELLEEHEEIEARDTLAFFAFLVAVALIGYMATRHWLGVIGKVVAGQKRAEEEQRRSEARFRSAFENVSVGNIIFRDTGVIEACNSAALTIFGYARDDVVGRTIKDLVPEAHWSAPVGAYGNIQTTDSPKDIGAGREINGVRGDGVEFPVHLVVSEMPTEEGRLFVGSVTDLSEIKELEQRLFRSQRLEAVGQLTGGVAHDFNNVMTTILGNAEILVESLHENEPDRRLAAAILRAVDRGSSLTQRLLAFSRKQVLFPVPADVAGLIDGLADMLRRTLGETITLTVTHGLTPWPAYIDPIQFESALVNLVLNARDAMPAGGVLEIETRNETVPAGTASSHEDLAPGDYVVVQVRDNGTGMSEETVRKAIEPFFTTKEVGKGSGLGLSMVYGFAKQSKGHIAITSAVDKGTTAELFLPRSVAVQKELGEAPAAKWLAPGSGRVLVVEDDAEVRSIASGILRKQGYEVLEASDHNQALKNLQDGPTIDLLFTDVVLPHGQNGVEIAEQARRLEPDIKVLFTSGYTENAVLGEGFDTDAHLLAKPYRKNELLEKVGRLLAVRPAKPAGGGVKSPSSALRTGLR